MRTGIPRTLSRLSGFFKYYTMTRAYVGSALYLLIGLNLAAAVVESIGILLFIPFLSQLSGGSTSSPDRVTALLYGLFSYLNIQVTVENTLAALVIAFTLKGFTVFCIHALRPIFLNGIRHVMREKLIGLYANLDYKYSMKKNTGFFGNLLVSETDRACIAMEWFCRALTALLTAATLFVIAFVCYRGLSVLMVVVGILSFMLLRKLSARAKYYSLQLTILRSRLNGFLIQALQSFKYLKVTTRIEVLQAQLSHTSEKSRETSNKSAVVNAMHTALQEPFLVMCLAGLSYYTVIVAGKSLPSVMVAGLFFYRCMIELGHFNNQWQLMSSNVGGLEMIWNTQKDLKKHQEELNRGAPFVFEKNIELKDLTYAYDSRPVLCEVNLCIPKYDSVAIVGVSGAGKTTLVDIITGLLKPSQGSVMIDGRDLTTLDLLRYRRSIGYVGQDTVLFDTTIADNISMQWGKTMDSSTSARILQAAQASYCDEFIKRLPKGYQTHVGERGMRLSGGQRQRLAIARELYRKPDVLILDEATSSLDSQSENYIRQSIEGFKGAMTLIIISHRLSTIVNADVIYVLDHGHVVEQGTFGELSRLQGTMFRRMCELQRVV